jgi:hypothetical protein
MNNGEGMPRDPHVGKPGPIGSHGVGFEVKGKGPWEASAWDEDVCVAAFETRHRAVLWARMWVWHFRFNRRSKHTNGSEA